MNIYSVWSDGSLISLKPRRLRKSAGDEIIIEGEILCEVKIKREGDDVKVTRKFAPGKHNKDLALLGAKDDRQVVLEYLNAKFESAGLEIEQKVDLQEIEGSPAMSAAFEQLVQEEMQKIMSESGVQSEISADAEEELLSYLSEKGEAPIRTTPVPAAPAPAAPAPASPAPAPAQPRPSVRPAQR